MQVNIKNLIDDTLFYDTVRELRWPEGRECPFSESRLLKGGSMKKSLPGSVMSAKDIELLVE